jgi:hypothetical protein
VADPGETVIWKVRAFVYRWFADTTRPPTVHDAASAFGMTDTEAAAVFDELDRRHAFFLDPGTRNIRIANPFSGVPTAFRVHANGRTYFANCAWDALGIPAALRADAAVEASCAESGEPLPITVADGKVVPAASFAHFLVPFRRWYDDMVFT